MAKARPRHFPPPLKGLEWRDAFQDAEGEAITADCMLNVDTSYGELRERDGFELVTAAPQHAQIHVTDHPDKSKRIITVGQLVIGSIPKVVAHVHDLGSGTTKFTVLTDLSGERYFDGFRCSFVPIRLPGGTEFAFDSTLIATPGFCYCVLPDGTVRLANMDDALDGGDCLRDNEKNISYIKNVPRGPIAVSHADKVFYMGWGKDTQFHFTSTVDNEEILVPGVVLDPGGGSYRLGSDWFMFSDEFSSLDIQAPHVQRTDDREEITGAASFKDVLVIFTDVSMYVLLGSAALDFQLRKIDGGVGCVSHWSIVQANGLLYWMARDGIYAFDGSKAQKVSVGIDQFWSDELRPDFVPDTFKAAAKSLGWPFSATRNSLNLVNSVHYRERSLLMWSIPSEGRDNSTYLGSSSLPVTLVYDYKHGGFYFWAMHDALHLGAYRPGTCMYDGFSMVDKGKETLFTTGFGATFGTIRKYGSFVDKPVSSGPMMVSWIPFLWMTGRVDKNVMGTARVQSVRFSILARGKEEPIGGVGTSAGADTHDVRWSVFDATTKHQIDLTDFSGPLSMYPPELLDDGSMLSTVASASPLLNFGTLDTMKIGSVDYFKSKAGGCRATDGSLRVALYSTGSSFQQRDSKLRMNAWSFEIDRGDTR